MFINFDNIIDDIVASTIRSLIILRYFGIRQKQFIQLS